MPNVLKAAAAMMAANILVPLGFIFVLFGISKFLNDYLGVDGAGEGVVGIALMTIGMIIILQSKMRVSVTAMPKQQPMPPQQPMTEAPSDSYR